MTSLYQLEAQAFEVVPPVILAALMFGLGGLLLLFGWTAYRVSVVVLGVLIGAAMGVGIALLVGIPEIFVAIPLGVVVGLMALGLQKVGAFLAGGLCGAVPLLLTADPSRTGPGIYVAAGLAFILAGLVAVLLWRPVVTLCLAIVGAALMANAVFLSAEHVSPGAATSFVERHPYVVAAGVALATLGGVLFQMRGEEPAMTRRRKRRRGTPNERTDPDQ